MQENARSLAKLCKLTALDLASTENYYYPVEEPDYLEFTFGKVADAITASKTYGKFNYASGSEYDYSADFYYDDAYFMRDASEYNASLATMSLCLALSAFASNDVSDYAEKSRNVQELLSLTGFVDFETNGYYKEKPSEDSIGVVAAHKDISIGGEKYTLIALATRGGGYEAEWAGNFTVGANGRHAGFETAANEAKRFLAEYIANYGSGFQDKVKIWLAGYSRASATVNLVAADLTANGGIGDLALEKENIYAYCFEPPQGENTENVSYEVAKSYTNIHNIVNRNDVVTKVAMKDWGFIRYGTDEDVIPTESTTSNAAVFDAMLEKFIALQTKAVEESIVEDENGNKIHVIDTFQAKTIDPRIDVNAKSGHFLPISRNQSEIPIWLPDIDFRLIVDDNKPMSVFLNNLVTQLSIGIRNRENYTEKLQSTVRLVITALMGQEEDMDKIMLCLDIFFDKIYSDSLFVSLSIIFGDETGTRTTDLLMEDLLESMEEAGLDWSAYEEFEDALLQALKSVVRTIATSMDLNGGSDLITLAYNYDFLFTAHYPELCLAWLQMQDINYTEGGRRLFLIDCYRVVHINCPVDVNVYDSRGNLVAQIIGDEPQDIDGSHIAASFSSDGEKLVYLPADEDYSIEMTATGDGTLSYGVNEYSYETSSFSKIVNYYDIPIAKGDVLNGTVEKFSEDDILNTGNGSSKGYELVHNNRLLSPTNTYSGSSASNATYLVTSQSDNRDGGAVIGGGAYAKGAYAQVTAIAFEKCSFTGWYVDDILVSTEESYRFRVESDVDLVAKFNGTRPTIGNGSYELTVVAGEGGSIDGEVRGYYSTGSQASITAIPKEGYVFSHWTTLNGGSFEDINAAETVFTMGEGDTVLTAVFKSEHIPCSHLDTEIKNIREATCTKKGYSGDVVCKGCGETLEAGKAINTIPHNYENGTCTACGKIHAHNVQNDVCTICGLSIQEIFRNIPSDSTSIVIPEGVVSIPDSAFRNFKNLTEVIIPEGVVSIGNNAFYGCNMLSNVTIPASVTRIGNSAFSGCSSLNSLTIPENVTSIERYAFYGCTSLTEITISNNITSIEGYTFACCNSLRRITIPNSVTKIGERAFQGCSMLRAIYIPSSVVSISASSVTNSPFQGCSPYMKIYCGSDAKLSGWGNYWNYYGTGKQLSVVYKMTEEAYEDIHILSSFPPDSVSIEIPYGVKKIPDSAFKGYTSLVSITLPESVTSIEGYAFSGCTSLESVTIPDSVTSIEGYAFSGCALLGSVTIPDSVTSIGNYAFNGCTSLTDAIIPDSVEKVGNYTFKGCTSLTNITFSDGLAVIGDYAFSDCTSLNGIAFPDSVTSIGNYAFSNCQALNNVVIPHNVEKIGDSVFSGCTSLNNITLPDGIASIGNSAFSNCTALRSIILPENVVSIGHFAFRNCTSLTDITIPDNVVAIGSNAFQGCIGLKVIYIPASVITINASAEANSPFYGCSPSMKIYCGAKTKPSGWGNYWNYYAKGKQLPATFGITREAFGDILILNQFPSDSTNIEIPYGVKTIPNSAFKGFTSLVRIVIPDSVTSIGDYAFSGCTLLEGITIPDSVTSMGNYVFNGCTSLTEATLSKGMTNIGGYTFNGCKSLTRVGIPDSITSIGSYAFSGCQALDNVIIPDKVGKIENNVFSDCISLINITIPDSVTSIGSYAFRNCISLTNITIPDNVTAIGSDAFLNCTGLKVIYIPSSVVTINASAAANSPFYGCSPTMKIYCGAKTKPSGWGNYWNYYAKDKQLSATFGITKEAFGDILILSQFPSDSTSIEIPYGVKTIPDFVFKNFTSLVRVTIPDSVTSIGDSAFYGCNSLTEITIPNSVASIGDSAFYGCTSLSSFVLPNSVVSVGNKAFYGCTSLSSFTISDNMTSIADYMFSGCTMLDNIVIPEGVTHIGNYTFSNCLALSSIKIPNSMTDIGNSAFLNCVSLKNIEIPDGIKCIRSYTFRYCTSLSSITLPESVIGIENNAFQACTGLKAVYIPASVTGISASAVANAPFYECSPTLKIYCGASAKMSGWGTYWNYYAANKALSVIYNGDKEDYNEKLIFTQFPADSTRIEIPDGVKEIPDWAFKDYTSLTSIIIPDSVVSIGDSAFYGCTSLTSVIIPDSVTKVGNSAFYGCTSLVDVTISNHMTSIEDSLFKECESLKSIRIPDSIINIGNYAFNNCTSLQSIAFSDGVKSIGKYAFANCTMLNNIVLPDSITTVGSNMFQNCTALNNITLSKGMKRLESYMFRGCISLEHINIPDGMLAIGYSVFQGCTGLKTIYIPSSVTSISATSAQNAPFFGCSYGLKIYCGTNAVKKGWGQYWRYYGDNLKLNVTLNVPAEEYEGIVGLR